MSKLFGTRFCCLLFLYLLTFPCSAHAALKAKNASATIKEATNPEPQKDDILLPMPCGGSMAFRAVGVQAEGFLWDMETLLGCDDCDRQENDYYERRYGAAISGPFSKRDVPAEWKGALGQAGSGEYFFYFIGKYELTNFQWKAMMEDSCPSSLTADDALPKTGISWFDSIAFSQKYMEWLLANHPNELPRFAGDEKNVGYVRLPTETEWEYASRGGHMVPRSDLRDQSFFALEPGTAMSEYAVYRSESRIEENTRAIGSRKPNPLGLYDAAGNAAEMTMDVFHFSLGGRLHGSAGGFVRKGGSYLSDDAGIMPGRREEIAFFQEKGATASKDMGVRFVLSGINTPAGDRPNILAKEWKKAGEGQGMLLDQGKNPLEELDRIIERATSATEKENLHRIRGILKDNNIALQRQNEAAAEGLIRSSVFIEEAVRNYAIRHKNVVNLMNNAKAEIPNAKILGPKAEAAVQDTLKRLEANRKDLHKSVDAAVLFYRSKVEESRSYPESMFAPKLALMTAEFKDTDMLSQTMRKAHDLYGKHVKQVRQGKQLTRDALLRDILPENLHEGLNIRK